MTYLTPEVANRSRVCLVASSDREEIDKLLAPLVEGGFTQKSTGEAPDGGCQGLDQKERR